MDISQAFGHYATIETSALSNEEIVREDLDRQGWSLGIITRIADEPLVIAYDRSLPGIPPGYAVYTADELKHISETEYGGHLLAMVHAAKKMGRLLLEREK